MPAGRSTAPEGNFLHVAAGPDRGGEEGLVADEGVLVDDPRLEIDARQARVEANARGERAFPKGMRNAELGEDRAAHGPARIAGELVAEGGLATLRHGLLAGHGEAAAAVQDVV